MYHRNRKSVVGGRWSVIAWVTVLLLLVAVTLIANAKQSRNAEAQKLKNPETSNPESIEAGNKLYQRHCASCHGKGGKGDGGMALSGGTPSDLTDEKWDFGASDGEIFTSIREGVSADMLEYKNKLDDKQIWQVVNFIRSIGPNTSKEK
jgi:mono/diheme cytochrome c family protein